MVIEKPKVWGCWRKSKILEKAEGLQMCLAISARRLIMYNENQGMQGRTAL